ncbi:MAG TPA: efflux RND transporter periplasmic adaptor subunit [Anaerolineaceae bacterium]
MRRVRNTIIVFTVLAGLGIAGVFVALGGLSLFAKDIEQQYQTAAVERGDIAAKVGSSGNAHARQTAILTWRTSGNVAGLAVQPGDHVEQNQLLAGLEPSSLSSNMIQVKTQLAAAQDALRELRETQTTRAETWNAVLTAQKALNDALVAESMLDQPNASPSNLEAAQAAYNLALAQVDSAEQMYAFVQGLPLDDPARLNAAASLERSYRERDIALINLQYAQGKPDDSTARQVHANLALAQANLEEAQRRWEEVKDGASAEQVRAAELRVESLEMTLAQASLLAPISGTATEVYIKNGDVVEAGTQAVRIDDFSERHIIVQVPEIDIVRVRLGQPALITFDALPETQYHGEVITVSRVGKLEAGRIEFEVEVRITDADDRVQPGLTAAVNVIVDQRTDVVRIPNRALRRANGQHIVYLIRSGALVSVPVTTGLSDESNTELLSGDVQPGDMIVLNPPASATQTSAQD